MAGLQWTSGEVGTLLLLVGQPNNHLPSPLPCHLPLATLGQARDLLSASLAARHSHGAVGCEVLKAFVFLMSKISIRKADAVILPFFPSL